MRNDVVIRDEPGEYRIVARYSEDGSFTVLGESIKPITLTVRVEDVWDRMSEQHRKYSYVAEVRRDEEDAPSHVKNMFTYPVLTISLLRKDGKFEDEEFARWGVEHNMKWSDSNIFIDDSVTSLSNCCRLKSNIEDLGYFNSIGGTALKVGSVKVSTVNLARLALEHETENDYLIALRDLVELDCKVLDVVRSIIRRDAEKGLLPNFTYGLVDFEHLYNTIGIIGIYETMKSFGYTREDEFGNVYYTGAADRFGKKIFDLFNPLCRYFRNHFQFFFCLSCNNTGCSCCRNSF